MKKALSSSETAALTRATRLNILEDAILHSHRREHLKSYIAIAGWTLYWRRNLSPVRFKLGLYIPQILHSSQSFRKGRRNREYINEFAPIYVYSIL
jgi:hypothetical protein